MSSSILNGVSAAIFAVCVVFMIVGAVGYSNNNDVVENVAWITDSESGVDVYYGLYKVVINFMGGTFTITYSDDQCEGNTCDACSKDGMAAVSLLAFALLFSVVGTCLSGILVGTSNSSMQAANCAMAVLAAFCSILALGVFMGDCYNRIKDDINSDDDNYDDDSSTDGLKWGPGSILTVISVILLFITSGLQVAAICMGDKTTSAPAGAEMSRA